MPISRRDVLTMGSGAAALAFLPPAIGAEACDLSATLGKVADTLLECLPEVGVYYGVPAALEGGPLARRMDDWSPAGQDHYRRALSEMAQSLVESSCPADPAGSLQLATAREVIASGIRSQAIKYGRPNPLWFSGHVPYVISPVAGPHIDTLNVMMAQQSLATPQALDAWLMKLEGLGPGFDAVREKLRADEALGCRPPQVLLSKSLPIFDAALAGDAAAQPLIKSLTARTAALAPPVRETARQRAIAAVEQQLRPAFARLREQIASMVPRGRMESGVWAQPQGEALYAANVRSLGGTSLTPSEIHRLGHAEIQRITAEMDALLRKSGYTMGSVTERFKAVSAEPRFHFAADEAGRAMALEYARQLVRGAEARYPEFLPRELFPHTQLEVRRVPPATQAGAPGAYSDPPSLDGKTPGIFWLNMRDMSAVTRIDLPTVTYHEGVPGHFTAGAIAAMLGGRPLLLQVASFNAYNEGWALYSERLMAELGAYRDDAFGDLGRLNEELLRAVRLVVDTGMHALRWTREHAIAFMSASTGVATSETVAEIERYMAWPGQALGYKLGQLRLLELRDDMRRAQGTRFDLREFHRAVLGHGNLPLAVLETVVAQASET
ncbi:MAG: DUF885 domain-containing protein [Acetobacteraceae bacterium]|nr:DUF885 domain-containing protein [Acetobacteraceae bacterium]